MKNFLILLCIFLTLFISGCSGTENKENVDNNPYLNIINQLTGEEMDGRLTGTEGNKKAMDFIKEQFNLAKLEPVFEQSYLHTYKHSFYEPEKQKFKLSIHYGNSEKKLVYEKDFIEQNSVESLQLQLPICPQQEEAIKSDCIFLTKNDFPTNNAYIKGVLVKKFDFFKRLPANLNGMPIFQIDEETYKILIRDLNKVKKIEMMMELSGKEIETYNVVGKITGTGHGDHRDAIVISAHFDSVGSIGDDYIEGAIDNATGVASLIQLAYNLKQYNLSNEIQSDIIFVAFNGEESGMQGSEAFVEDIVQSYKNISNINIDSIGIKGVDEYIIVNTENGQVLRDRLTGYLSDHQFDILQENPSLTSDHMSFSKKNYPAVTIGQKDLNTIHTLNDRKDVVDAEKLHEIVTGLFNYIVDTESVDLEINHIESELTEEELNVELMELANEEVHNLDFGQYKVLSTENTETGDVDSIFVFNADLTITSISSIPKSLAWLNIPTQLKDYSFNKANIQLKIMPDNYDLIEPNMVYETDSFSKNDFNILNLTYLDTNSEGYEILISTEQILNNEKNEVFSHQGQEYTVYDSYSYLNIHTMKEWDNKTYYYAISKIKQTEEGDNILLWTAKDIEEALQTIDSLDLEEWTKQMGI